jgi:hypothetical protein
VSKVWYTARFAFAEILRTIADRVDPDLVVRKYAGGVETRRRTTPQPPDDAR